MFNPTPGMRKCLTQIAMGCAFFQNELDTYLDPAVSSKRTATITTFKLLQSLQQSLSGGDKQAYITALLIEDRIPIYTACLNYRAKCLLYMDALVEGRLSSSQDIAELQQILDFLNSSQSSTRSDGSIDIERRNKIKEFYVHCQQFFATMNPLLSSSPLMLGAASCSSPLSFPPILSGAAALPPPPFAVRKQSTAAASSTPLLAPVPAPAVAAAAIPEPQILGTPEFNTYKLTDLLIHLKGQCIAYQQGEVLSGNAAAPISHNPDYNKINFIAVCIDQLFARIVQAFEIRRMRLRIEKWPAKIIKSASPFGGTLISPEEELPIEIEISMNCLALLEIILKKYPYKVQIVKEDPTPGEIGDEAWLQLQLRKLR